MTLNDYQEKAMQTCMPTSANFAYQSLNLVGEIGELFGKIAKAIRNDELDISHNHLVHKDEIGNIPTELEAALKHEAGDVLWQFAGLCKSLGWDMEEIAKMNLDKLQSRKERNKINGSGDNR